MNFIVDSWWLHLSLVFFFCLVIEKTTPNEYKRVKHIKSPAITTFRHTHVAFVVTKSNVV